MSWAYVKFKAKKSRSIVLKRGKVDEQYHFELGEETIPTVLEHQVKSLGRWYTDEMKDMK